MVVLYWVHRGTAGSHGLLAVNPVQGQSLLFGGVSLGKDLFL